jgi:hypothetical protein
MQLSKRIVVLLGLLTVVGVDFVDGWAVFFRPDDAPTIAWKPDEVHVFPSGDLGSSRGSAQIRGHDRERKPRASPTNTLTIWRKDQDGTWRALVDIGTEGTPIPVTQQAGGPHADAGGPRQAPPFDKRATRNIDLATLLVVPGELTRPVVTQRTDDVVELVLQTVPNGSRRFLDQPAKAA